MGTLPADARSALAEFPVEPTGPGLMLVTTVTDDAQLHGILAQLRCLGLRLVSMRPVPCEADLRPAGDTAPAADA
jgi:hypothetical protein